MSETIIKMTTDLELQKFDGEVGKLTAYVTTFGNTDKVGDIIAPGALDKFLKEFEETKQRLPMLWQHDKNELIGEWTAFEINSRGVKGTGEIFTEVSRGNDVRNLIKRGAVGSVSIGFTSKQAETLENGGRLFKEIRLVETSVVINPANPRAKITSAKNEDGSVNVTNLEKILRDAGLSRKESKTLLSSGGSDLRDAVKEELKKIDFLQQLKSELGE